MLRAREACGLFDSRTSRALYCAHVNVLQRQIIEAIVEFLETHGIDPSDIKEQRATILNSGLIVQGGGGRRRCR